MKFRYLLIISFTCLFASSCSIVSENRVFPKLTWYWSEDAKNQRDDNLINKQYEKSYNTNNINK